MLNSTGKVMLNNLLTFQLKQKLDEQLDKLASEWNEKQYLLEKDFITKINDLNAFSINLNRAKKELYLHMEVVLKKEKEVCFK
jgi:hypothetical protein